jgi:hypothetical protein
MDVEFPALPDTPVGRCLADWHDFLRGDRGVLERIVAEDAVFYSPVLYRPQVGRELVVLYLTGASMSFPGDGAAADGEAPSHPHPSGGTWDGRFRYVRTVVGVHDAVLEFETVMRGTYVNGVDLIRCDDAGLITDFKVMIRPLRALDAVRESMMAALGQLRGDATPA